MTDTNKRKELLKNLNNIIDREHWVFYDWFKNYNNDYNNLATGSKNVNTEITKFINMYNNMANKYLYKNKKNSTYLVPTGSLESYKTSKILNRHENTITTPVHRR